MAEFKEQFIGDTSVITYTLDEMVLNAQKGEGRFNWQLNEFTALQRDFQPTSLKDFAENATLSAVVTSIQYMRKKQLDGYDQMIYATIHRGTSKSPTPAIDLIAREGLKGGLEVHDYLLAITTNDIARPLSENLKQKEAKIAARKLPSGIVLVSFGSEDEIAMQFDFFTPVVKDAVRVFNTIFGEEGSEISGSLVLWNDPSVDKLVVNGETLTGMHDAGLGVSVLYYDRLGIHIPHLANPVRKRIAAHEVMHIPRFQKGEYMGNFAEEGLIQLASLLVSGEDIEKVGHFQVSDADADINQVRMTVDDQMKKADHGTTNPNISYRFHQNYRVSASFFTALAMLSEEPQRLVQLGQFVKILTDYTNLETTMESVYGINLDEFQAHWKASVQKAQKKYPRLILIEPSSFKVIPFGRKELEEISALHVSGTQT